MSTIEHRAPQSSKEPLKPYIRSTSTACVGDNRPAHIDVKHQSAQTSRHRWSARVCLLDVCSDVRAHVAVKCREHRSLLREQRIEGRMASPQSAHEGRFTRANCTTVVRLLFSWGGRVENGFERAWVYFCARHLAPPGLMALLYINQRPKT